jgi:hypothetical protein
MAKFDTAFNPYVSYITKPTGENEIQVAAGGVLDYLDRRDKKKEDELKTQDREALRRDNKRLAQFGTSDMTLGAFSREHGGFETAEGISAAHKMRMDRAKQRLNEKKAMQPKGKTSEAGYVPPANPSVFEKARSLSSSQSTKETASPSGAKPNAPAKTVTVYKDGKPVTYTVEG